MAQILYTYKGGVYVNLTNKCNCRCTFCIRFQHDGIGDAPTLWHKVNPTWNQVKKAIDTFDFTGFQELVFAATGNRPVPFPSWNKRLVMYAASIQGSTFVSIRTALAA